MKPATETATAPAATPTADADRITALCRHIETHLDEPLTLDDLARVAGWSRFHLQRRFKQLLGLSPREYVEALRLRELRAGLRVPGTVPAATPGGAVTTAIHAAGYGSASRVYERADGHLGMTPRAYRRGGAGVALSWAARRTALGWLLIAASDRGLCFVQFGDSAEALLAELQREFPQAALSPMPAAAAGALDAWMDALDTHLDGRGPAPELPVDLRGTAFQHRVWTYLLRIPAGEIRTYQQVAEAIGSPRAVRAVGSACGANRIGVVVPCHRVIRGDGGLGGYRWGLERKQRLLALEREQAAAGPHAGART